MKIRKSTTKDLKEIGKLMKTEFSKFPFNEKDSIDAVLKSLRFYFRMGKIFIAIADGKIAGVIIVKFEQYWEGKVMIIEDLAVGNKFQNKWVGKELMNFAENYAKNKKTKLILFSTNKKSRAIEFYKKEEYKIDKDRIFMKKKVK